MDIRLLEQMGEEFKRRFADVQVDKILTIEASGIGIACIAARYFDVPVVFAKKDPEHQSGRRNVCGRGGIFTHKCKTRSSYPKSF